MEVWETLCWLVDASPLRWLGFLYVLGSLLPECCSQTGRYRCKFFDATAAFVLFHMAIKMYVNSDCGLMVVLACCDVTLFHLLASGLVAWLVVAVVRGALQCPGVGRLLKRFKIEGMWAGFAVALGVLVLVHRWTDAAVNRLMDVTLRSVYEDVLPDTCQ